MPCPRARVCVGVRRKVAVPTRNDAHTLNWNPFAVVGGSNDRDVAVFHDYITWFLHNWKLKVVTDSLIRVSGSSPDRRNKKVRNDLIDVGDLRQIFV